MRYICNINTVKKYIFSCKCLTLGGFSGSGNNTNCDLLTPPSVSSPPPLFFQRTLYLDFTFSFFFINYFTNFKLGQFFVSFDLICLSFYDRSPPWCLTHSHASDLYDAFSLSKNYFSISAQFQSASATQPSTRELSTQGCAADRRYPKLANQIQIQ